jgi:N,N'-diacetylchitobiose transport system substrate-binding protein
MKRLRIVALAGVVALLAVAATTASGGIAQKSATKLVVWLQTDAQADNWKPITDAANKAFEASHPGMTVDVQYQQWGTHLTKFDATLAAGSGPDVIEMGNTEMTKYMAAGAFADISSSKSSFENAKTWLAGLAASGTYGGKLFGVPYYAGSRVVTYRADQFKSVGAKAPTSLAELQGIAGKLGKKFGKKGYSPIYVAGTDWYFAMSFVFDYGGGIAHQVSGKWKGILDSPKSIAGLNAFKNFFKAVSKAGPTSNEATPAPYNVYGQGLAGAVIGPAGFSCCVGKFKAQTAQFVMPGHVKGQVMPGFLGGSDLAVPVTSSSKQAAIDWLKIYTGTSSEKALQAIGNIPNTTSLFNASKVNEKAASRSWFVPTAKNWVNVENENILRNMLAQILTGRLTTQQAALAASDAVASILNATS